MKAIRSQTRCDIYVCLFFVERARGFNKFMTFRCAIKNRRNRIQFECNIFMFIRPSRARAHVLSRGPFSRFLDFFFRIRIGHKSTQNSKLFYLFLLSGLAKCVWQIRQRQSGLETAARGCFMMTNESITVFVSVLRILIIKPRIVVVRMQFNVCRYKLVFENRIARVSVTCKMVQDNLVNVFITTTEMSVLIKGPVPRRFY